MDFMKAYIYVFFESMSRKFNFYENKTRVTGTLRDDLCTFTTISFSILKRIKNIFKKIVEKIKTHILCAINFLFAKMVLIMRNGGNIW